LRAATADFWRGLLLTVLRGALVCDAATVGFASGFSVTTGLAADAAGGSKWDGGPSGVGSRTAAFRSKEPPSILPGCASANEAALMTIAAVKNDNVSNRFMGFTASRRVPLAQTHMIGGCAGKGIFPSQKRVFCGHVLD
jgi:hypothetical protein